MPMTGAQRRSTPAAFSEIPQIASAVTRAESGAANAGVSSGTWDSIPNTIGITVTGISMMTVPETVGVRMRRRSESRHASRN